jgi:diguanylate cyclase (GGDEF)-like protein/PAS domain S-box-containing protein
MLGRRLAIGAAALVLPATLALFPWLLTDVFSSTYLPHGFCFQWNPRLVWLHVVSDAAIWLSYTAIAINLAVVVGAIRKRIPFKSVFVLFGTFILACGFTHLMDVVVLWWPLYWLQGDMKLVTAAVSLVTAATLPFVVPQLKAVLARAEASAENARRFLAATNSSMDAFYILESVRDGSGKIVDFRHEFVNSTAAALLNLRAEEIVGRSICDVVPANRTSGLVGKYARVVETGEPFTEDLCLQDFGNVNAAWLKMQVVKLDDGVAITCADISELKRRQQTLADNERRFVAVAESSLDSLFLMESVRGPGGRIEDFRILFVNENAAHLVGIARERMVGGLLCELMPDHRPRGLFDSYCRIVETGEPRAVESLVAGFSGIHAEWVKLQAVKLDDGVAVTISDITERKRRERISAENERRFLAASDSSLDSFYILDAIRDISDAIVDFRFAYVNPRAAALINQNAEQLIGQAMCDLYPWHREEGYFDLYKGVVESGESAIREFAIQSRDVNASWLKMQIVKLDDGVAITCSDISEQRRREYALAENERRFVAAAESNLNNFYIFDSVRDADGEVVDFRFRYVNSVGAHFIGREPAEVVGRLLSEVVPETVTDGYIGMFRGVVESGEPLAGEYEMDFEAVEASWMALQVTKLDDGVAVTSSDITERKRSAALLAENERRFLAVAEASLDSLCVLAAVRDAAGTIVDFRFVFVNTIGARLIGREPGEVIGGLLSVLIPENRPAGLFDQYVRVIETGEPRIDEFPIDFKNIDASWVKCQVVKLEDGVAITTSDISERKRREEVVAENQRRFLAVAECSLDSLFLLESHRGPDGGIVDFRILFVNEKAARLVGFSREEMIGGLLCELMPANRPQGFFDGYRRVVETGEPWVLEFPVTGFPEVRAEWLKIQVVKLDDGVAVTCSDVTERKHLELERETALAESLIDKSPAAILVTGADYLIRALNPAAKEMLQCRSEELVGHATPLVFYHPAEVKAAAARLSAELGMSISAHQAVFEYGSARGSGDEWTFLRGDGSPISVEVTVTPLRSEAGHETAFMITAYDISERKRREEAAANAKSQMEAISRSQMIVEFAMDGAILYANENYLEVFGYSADDLRGKFHSVLVPEEDRATPEYREFWDALRRGEFRRGEFRRIAKDGSEVWIEASYNPILDRNGVPVRVVKFSANVTERVRMQGAIRDAESRTKAILDNVVDGIISIDAAGTIVSINPAGVRMFEYEAAEVIGQNVKMLMPEPDRGGHDGHLARYRSTGKTRIIGVGRELDGLAKSGRTFPMELTITEVSVGEKRLFVGVVRDITERKRAEHEARKARAFRESLIENSPAAIIVTDVDFTISAMNPAAQKLLWYQPEELVGRGTPLIFYDHTQAEARTKRLAAETGAFFAGDEAGLAAPEITGLREAEWTFFRKGGSTVIVQVTVTALNSEDGEPTGYMITAYDVSERKRREEYISHLAHHDVLTGLPTRQLLMDRLEMMLARSRRFSSKSALLMIDLNNFKQVNDSLGHHVGDRLLIQVAERLRSAVRTMDTVARMGGDEFVVLISDIESASSAEQVAAKLLSAFRAPFSLGDQNDFDVHASIGVCVFPEGGADANALLRNADIAMYYAKATRRHAYQLFDQKIAEAVVRQREMESALAGALDAGELYLDYQPQFSLTDGAMVGFEALLRWKSRQFGPVSPGVFIPVAESSGLILPIGAWVIQTACREMRRLQSQFGDHLVMAVNLSPRQLDQPGLLDVIKEALTDNRISPACFEMEITESVLMSDSAIATDFFEGLRQLGARVAIDDFGTGFSSMAYLLRFSVNRLKIDRCFIQDSPHNQNSATVTSAIIALAHQLKVSVLAEGVENDVQREFLKAAGCDDAQGFHLCRPMAPEMIASAVLAQTTSK